MQHHNDLIICCLIEASITAIVNVIKLRRRKGERYERERAILGAKSFQTPSRIRSNEYSHIRSVLVGMLSKSHETSATVEINACHVFLCASVNGSNRLLI